MSVLLIGTLDTKGVEIGFVRDRLREAGAKVLVLDAGALGVPAIPADISREDVFRAAGTTLEAVRNANDRGNAVTLAAAGAAKLAAELHAFPAGPFIRHGDFAPSAGIGRTQAPEMP